MNKQLLEDLKTTHAVKGYLTELARAHKTVTGVYPTNEQLVAAVNTHFGFQILEFREHWNTTDTVTDAFLSNSAKCLTEDWRESLEKDWNIAGETVKSLGKLDTWKKIGIGTIGGMIGRGFANTAGPALLPGGSHWLVKTPVNALGWWVGERVPQAAAAVANFVRPGTVGAGLSRWIPKGGTFTGALGAELGMQIGHKLGFDGFWGQLGSGIAGQYGMHKAVEGAKGFLKSPTGRGLVSKGMGALRNVATRAGQALTRFGSSEAGGMATGELAALLGTDVAAASGTAIAGTALAGAGLGTGLAYGINRAIGGADYANRQFELNSYNPKTWWEGVKGIYKGAKGLVGLDIRDSQDIAREQQIAAAGERNKQLADQTRDMSPEERGRAIQAEFDRVAAKHKQQTNESTLLEQAVHELFQLNEIGAPHIEIEPHIEGETEIGGHTGRKGQWHWYDYINPERWGEELANRTARLFGVDPVNPHDIAPTETGDRTTTETGDRTTTETGDRTTTETETETETETDAPAGSDPEGPLDPGTGRQRRPTRRDGERGRGHGSGGPRQKTETRPTTEPKLEKEPPKENPKVETEIKPRPGDFSGGDWTLPLERPEYPALDQTPPNEKYAARKAIGAGHPVYDPNSGRMLRMTWDPSTVITENKLSDNESANRKSEKQKYKVVYMQNGKKVEVFASSVRGVRRVVYGKNQYRIYDSKGSDVTAYVKKMMSEGSK